MTQKLFRLEKERRKINCDIDKNRHNINPFESVPMLFGCEFESECQNICLKKGIFQQEYEKIKGCNNNHDFLTENEVVIIRMYLGKEIYEKVNQQLRNSPQSEIDKDVLEYGRLLNLVLDKLPSFDNEVAYRDIHRPVNLNQLLDFYENTDKYIEPAFMSSHTEKGHWGGTKEGVHLIIHTKKHSNGKVLGRLNLGEKEVLFKMNTSLKVIRVKQELQEVELQEV